MEKTYIQNAKRYPVFSATIARQLIRLGFIVRDIKINEKNLAHNENGELHKRDDFIIFFFDDTSELRKEMAIKAERAKLGLNTNHPYCSSNSSSDKKE